MALLLILLLSAGVLTLGFGFLAPAKLALIQEHAISLLHGGIAGSDERTFIDACVSLPDADGTQAVTRTVRTTNFHDGTSLSVTFSSAPSPTNSQCR
jgi:hypothetical protein